MRIESCRTCGENMKEFQRCHSCNEIINMICGSCNKIGEAQVHENCDTLDGAIILN